MSFFGFCHVGRSGRGLFRRGRQTPRRGTSTRVSQGAGAVLQRAVHAAVEKQRLAVPVMDRVAHLQRRQARVSEEVSAGDELVPQPTFPGAHDSEVGGRSSSRVFGAAVSDMISFGAGGGRRRGRWGPLRDRRSTAQP